MTAMSRAHHGARVPSIIVHGGAGADPRDGRSELRAGVRAALDAGWKVLAAGGLSLDAVEHAVRALEEHPRFNAGRGSVLTSSGTVEMDASSDAARVAVDLLVEEGRGDGGLILIDWRGRPGFAHSTPLMPVGWMSPALAAPDIPF